jgi:HK97 family phage prohead protease
MAETFRVPQGVQDEAKMALGWIADGHAGGGFTAVGKKRASDLAAGHPVSAQTILRMYSFLKRHEVDKQAQGFNSGEDGFPSPGRVSWSAWGGDAGLSWSTRIRNQISKSARALSLMASEDDMADMNQVPDLNEELTELLADVVSFYFRAHGAHWNVKGADFSEYHKLFQKIYEDVYESIDPIAENLRKLGSIAPFTLGSFMALRCLEDAPAMLQDPIALANDLLIANDMIIDELSDAFDCASMYNQQGVANFLAGRIDSHQYWKWQLTVSLGQEVTQPSTDPVDAQGVDADDDQPYDQVDDMLAEQGLAPMPIMPRSEELSEEERASAARIGEGSFVSWNTSNGRAKGKVEKVATKGQAKSSEGYTIEATPDHPAFVIRIYKEQGNGWIPSDVTTVHRPDILTVINALPAPRSEELSMIEERKTAMAQAERITMLAEVRAVDTKDGSLKIGGYAATFNNEASGLNFREVIAPGAFTRALASADPVFLLVNHDMEGIPLASTQSGTLTLRQDGTGLYMEATLDPANPKAQELSSALRRGDMDKMSFAFTVSPDGQTKDAGLRTLTDIERLYEVSVVTLPAYDSTSVGMRSAEEIDLELAKRKLSIKVKQHSLSRKSKA